MQWRTLTAGCHHPARSLAGLTVSAVPACRSVPDSQARFCSCNTELCNLNLYNYSDYSRVKRHRADSRQNFVFPFQPQSESELVVGGGELETRGVRCYSCGSLFSRDVPHCPQFSRENITQRQTCDQASVLHSHWSRSDDARLSLVERSCYASSLMP